MIKRLSRKESLLSTSWEWFRTLVKNLWSIITFFYRLWKHSSCTILPFLNNLYLYSKAHQGDFVVVGICDVIAEWLAPVKTVLPNLTLRVALLNICSDVWLIFLNEALLVLLIHSFSFFLCLLLLISHNSIRIVLLGIVIINFLIIARFDIKHFETSFILRSLVLWNIHITSFSFVNSFRFLQTQLG